MSKHIPSNHEIETYSGSFVDVSNPSYTSITLEDIAHALSNICRYGGHCQTFYSVAEHAVFVSQRLERQGFPRLVQIAGLHHDDAEAFLGDIPRPIKPLLGQVYEDMSDEMDSAVCNALYREYDVELIRSDFHSSHVKTADNWALMVEARHLLPSEGRMWFAGAQGAAQWGLPDQPTRIVTPDYWRGGLIPKRAERLFIERHKELITP